MQKNLEWNYNPFPKWSIRDSIRVRKWKLSSCFKLTSCLPAVVWKCFDIESKLLTLKSAFQTFISLSWRVKLSSNTVDGNANIWQLTSRTPHGVAVRKLVWNHFIHRGYLDLNKISLLPSTLWKIDKVELLYLTVKSIISIYADNTLL